jgi:hypothetical protein
LFHFMDFSFYANITLPGLGGSGLKKAHRAHIHTHGLSIFIHL